MARVKTRYIKAIYKAKCCRVWTVAMGWPLGQCGQCGDKPTPIFGTVQEVNF